MTSTFLKNLYLGTKCSDDELEVIPHPRFELHYHVMYKTIQAGSILGLCVFGPLVGLVRGRGNLAMIRSSAMKGGRIGAALGIPLGPFATEMTLRGDKGYSEELQQERIYDRSYRIRYHTSQLRCDRWATLGAVAGLGAGYYMGGALLNGTIIGLTAGTITAAVYSAKLANDEMKKAPKRMLNFKRGGPTKEE